MKRANDLVLFAALVCLIVACGGGNNEKANAKPAVTLTSEAGLMTLTLTPEAKARLGIELVAAQKKTISRRRTLGGDLLLSLAPQGNVAPSAFSLFPPATPADLVRLAELQIDADGRVAAARVQVEGAQQQLERARTLVASKLGTERQVDDAHVAFRLAEEALHAADERRNLLGEPIQDAAKRQQMLVRVAVYAGEVDHLDRAASARVRSLGDRKDAPGVAASPVEGPLSRTGTSASVDVFYKLDGAGTALRPGERVAVDIPLSGSQEAIIVPQAALLYDIHGGAWIYRSQAAQTYIRERVEVRFVADGLAVLGRGPEAGTLVVTEGAAELFGSEFSTGK